MSNVEDVRKGIQDFLAPEIRELRADVKNIKAELPVMEARLSKKIGEVQADLPVLENRLAKKIEDVQAELPVMENRLLKTIEAAKNEILLTLKVNSQQERIAELTRENDRLKGLQTH